jgi:hypothetical protein
MIFEYTKFIELSLEIVLLCDTKNRIYSEVIGSVRGVEKLKNIFAPIKNVEFIQVKLFEKLEYFDENSLEKLFSEVFFFLAPIQKRTGPKIIDNRFKISIINRLNLREYFRVIEISQ